MVKTTLSAVLVSFWHVFLVFHDTVVRCHDDAVREFDSFRWILVNAPTQSLEEIVIAFILHVLKQRGVSTGTHLYSYSKRDPLRIAAQRVQSL
jgi:hypothetical protein